MTRIGVSFVSHPLFSALVCTGAIYLIGTVAQPRRIGRGLGFVLAGMFLHFTWDDAGGLGGGSGVQTIAVMAGSIVVAMVLLAIAFRAAAPHEHQFVREMLAPEVETGVISPDEVEAVVDKSAREKYRRSAPNHQTRRARKHLRHAILDLTHDIAQSGGARTDAVDHARAEVVRLRSGAKPE